jgi:hypothetical protein
MRTPKLIAVMQTACLASLAAPSVAQVQRGVVHGSVQDSTGAALPGAVLILTSGLAASRETTSDGRGEFRFPDLDPGEYALRATLARFAPLARPRIIVGVGASVELRIAMVVGGLSEQVTVSDASPVLDSRRQGHVTNFDQAMLNGVPTARDPWALMPHVPGVAVGRPNVGGSESTNQAQFAARGDNGTNTMWNIDGVTITDMAATGASPTYYDFNVFEEVQFTTGSLDARQQTGGLGINLVSKRGTNALHGSARAYYSNDELQAENISDEQRAEGLSGNRITQLAEYGADIGGPLWKDHLWLWAAAARTDVRQLAINGFPDEGAVDTLAARLDAEISSATRLSFLYHRGEKVKDGRGAGPTRPPETTWDQEGPSSIYKAEVSHAFGPQLFLSAKLALVDFEFYLTPQAGLSSQAYLDFATQIWHGGFNASSSVREQQQAQLDGYWSRGAHELKFGGQYRRTESDEANRWPGDETVARVNLERQGLPPGVGLANLTRRSAVKSATDTTSLYAGDVVRSGRWTLDLGLRFDSQSARNLASSAPANGLAPDILPALEYPGGPERTWRSLSPRLAATFRAGDKTLVKASYARFPSQLGSSAVTFENAAQAGSIQYQFRDANGDNLAQRSELLGPTGVVSGVNPADPAAPYAPNQVDPDLRSPAADVFVAALERELWPNFSAGVSVGYSRQSDPLWRPFTGLASADFVEYRTAGTAAVPSDTPVYRLASGVTLPPGGGRTLTNQAGYHQNCWSLDLVANRRLANRFMLRGFVTLQQQREYFDDPSRAIQDPTPRVQTLVPFVSGLVDGGAVVNLTPGGQSEFFINARWSYSVSGLYELPWGLSLAGSVYGREGYPIGEVITVNRPDGLGLTPVLIEPDMGARRFPSLHLLDLRLQKRLALGRAEATLNLDLFNALNSSVVLRQQTEGTATTFRSPQEILAPRLLRLGLQVRF